ncbi:hypothetical protein BV20DRAFT_1117191 [Pilatotrama ljubarskyi]|nr:hypothetical protein BV20DRAFT_1117191 [Pilatotrama ljubarskyi]
MSHLTAPMPTGHRVPKSYLFDFPRPAHPLTPPDTDYETQSHQAAPLQAMAGLETEPFPPQQLPSVTDSPYASLHRKRSSVTYVNSGLRESRERVVQRGLRWLVVVLPPVSFTREHGHLGHTLSSGPTRRLSNGILMPLYPTLNSQLGAIAREFSFPSISGICVYLHTTHGGLSLSPRVSDESWPLLWGHLFDARSPSLPPQQLPISGQIEFDIDLSKARWYDAWLGSSRRDYVDVPQSVTPSRAQSVSHWRGDSQTSINEPLDDQTDAISVVQLAKTNGRNIRKLSLLDRFDGASVRSGSKLVPRDESPPSQTARQGGGLQALSPIVQEDEPATAKKAIDSRVQSWRMSATAAARSPLAATGQTSLDPVNMPNTMADLPTASTSEVQSELNLDDYAWSVSSVGPPEYDLESVASWDRVLSVHMDRRGEGSVCLTPSICTSFGPDDEYDPSSPISYMSRLPSPDLALRMLEDVPPTPTTATSWGAPLSYPPSPLLSPYAPSVDIAGRCLSSRPATPSTATSWGAPSSFPPSPMMPYRAPSPDLGERGMSSVPNSPMFRRRALPSTQPYELVYPYYDAARASSWQHVWPYAEETHAAQAQVAEQREALRMQGFVFPPPAGVHAKAEPWRQVWPYAASSADSGERVVEAARTTLGYPVMDIYPAVYPSLDIYPALLTLDDRKLGARAVSSGAAYPIFDLYPAVYPAFDIYPAALTIAGAETKEVSARLSTPYPIVEPYPPAYPHLTIYPAVSHKSHGISTSVVARQSKSTPSISVRLRSEYPVFNIYPAVYPHCFDEIYPAIQAAATARPSQGIDVRLNTSYPTFVIYPSVYPYSLECLYPSVVAWQGSEPLSSFVSVGVRSQYPVFDIYPALSEIGGDAVVRGVPVKLPRAYPVLDIYPAVYPWNLQEMYPAVPAARQRDRSGIVVKLAPAYPVFDIYPAVYPHSLLYVYPALPSSSGMQIRAVSPSIAKPYLSLRPSVRPTHLRKSSLKRELPPVPPLPKNARELTPFSPVSRRPLPLGRVEATVPVRLNAAYPNVCPYPPVYPHFAIYPDASSGDLSTVEVELSGKVPAVSQYPYLVIYPAAYPYIEIYPGSWGGSFAVQIASNRTAARRRPKYTHMELRSQVLAPAKAPLPAPALLPARKPPTFSHMQLREQVLATERATRERQLPKVIIAHSSPATPELFSPPEPEFEFVTPTVRSAGPASRAPFSPPEPEFEIVAVPAPTPVSAAPRMQSVPPVPSRSRSGTVNSRPPVPPPPRPVGARASILVNTTPAPSPDALHAPSQSAPHAPSPSRSINRLSGLPPHPAANRRMSAAAPAPRPMSTFGPLPAVPEPSPGPSPIARRQRSMMSPLEEEGSSPIHRSPQHPSPSEDWQRSYRTPSDTSPTSRLSMAGSPASLSRSNTMPTRAAPRGPRGSTLISERARLFNASGGNGEAESPTKLMSTLAEFPIPPRPSLPSSPARPVVSKLDRSKYPFA